MLKFLKRFVMLCFVAGVCYGAYYVYTETTLFKITSIEFTKHETMDLETLTQYAGVKKGDFYLSVTKSSLEENIKNHPFVKTAEVKKVFPNQVIFNLTYREHFFNLYYSDIVLSMDDTLSVLSVLDEPKEGYTVLGFSFDSFSVGRQVKVSRKYVLENIVLLIDLLNQSQLKADKTIVFEDDDILITVGGIKGNFGMGENINDKFNAFINIYDALMEDSIESGTIDVSSEGYPVFRPFGE